jgi:flavin-dependent dehydrogenase
MKVAIIGAGICGLYLAWKLSENGQEVIIFEKKAEIGKEVCSGLVSERILEFVPESKKLIQNKIDYCLIHFPKKTLKIEFARNFLVMSHFELDHLVAKLAEKSGAKILLNYNVTLPFLVTLTKAFNMVIGCDGPNSEVRQFLELKNPQFYLGIRGFIEKSDKSNFVETWPTSSGFIWKIPRGRKIEYGIIEKSREAKKLLDNFLKRKNIRLESLNSALIPQGLIIPKNQKITLCGDAMGLTKPWSGGGVVWGLTAADIFLKNFPYFSRYQKEIKKFFLPKIILSKMAKKLVYFFGFNFPWIFPKEVKIEGDFLI